jgi:hypothetical protein
LGYSQERQAGQGVHQDFESAPSAKFKGFKADLSFLEGCLRVIAKMTLRVEDTYRRKVSVVGFTEML